MEAKQRGMEIARVWALGLTEAIESQRGQQVKFAIAESSAAEAARLGHVQVLEYRFHSVDARLWVAAGGDTPARVAGGEANAAAEDWRRLLDAAACCIQAGMSEGTGASAKGQAAGQAGAAPAAQPGTSIPEAPGAVFALELTADGAKLGTLFLGVTEGFEEAWRAERVQGATENVVRAAPATLELLLDVELPLSVSFGRTYLPVRDILKLSTGSIVELNCPANEYVDVIVNNCTIARGEVVVVEGNYGVRIDEIISRRERMLLQHNKGLNAARPMRVGS